MRDLLRIALDLYFYAIIVWVILSWVPVTPGHPVTRFQYALGRIIEPVLRPIRQLLPPIRMGAAALDLSPIVLIFLVQILRRLV
ncbi:MAG: YggT family protein [Acidimicrobiales bacterium]|nr:YggT family protein [Acidimicrobiales bacterium]